MSVSPQHGVDGPLPIETSQGKQGEVAPGDARDEIEPHVEGPAGSLSGEIDQLKAQIAELTQSERRARQTVSELQAVFNVFPDLYFRFSDDVKVLDFSGDASLLHMLPEELLGKPVQEILPPEAAEIMIPAIRRVVETRVPDRIEYSLKTPEQIRYFDAILVPFRSNQVISIVRDITEKQRAGEDLRRQTSMLQSILDGLSDGVVVVDAGGRLILYNPAAKSILGLEEIDIGTQTWSRRCELYCPDGRTPYPENELPLSKAITGTRCDNVEVCCRKPDSALKHWISASGRPLRDVDGHSLGGVVAFRDITQEKASRDALLADQQFMERLLMAHEHDRRLTAYEIHDGLVQYITGALMHL